MHCVIQILCMPRVVIRREGVANSVVVYLREYVIVTLNRLLVCLVFCAFGREIYFLLIWKDFLHMAHVCLTPRVIFWYYCVIMCADWLFIIVT